MKKEKEVIIFYYVEVLNETEQLMVFSDAAKNTGVELILNTALPIEVQDIQINKKITRLLKAEK